MHYFKNLYNLLWGFFFFFELGVGGESDGQCFSLILLKWLKFGKIL